MKVSAVVIASALIDAAVSFAQQADAPITRAQVFLDARERGDAAAR
ncbi:hypothetical protein [Paraburkholderia translucens]